MVQSDPPYRRIAAELRRRITAGELSEGDRLPSTRQICAEWGVALATAVKALNLLRDEGLALAKARVGTVVAAPVPGTAWVPGRPAPEEVAASKQGAPASGDAPGPLTPGPLTPGPLTPGPLAFGEATARVPRRAALERGLGRSRRRAAPAGDRELTRERVVRAAIDMADAEGLEALSMRGVAARLGVATMSPYRYVTGKDELVLLMADAAFGDHDYPDDPPAGWRARLELGARRLWAVYLSHPWLAQVSPLTRPLPLPNLVRHGEWGVRALDGLGLDPGTVRDVLLLLQSYVQGIAANIEREAHAEAASGLSGEEWASAQQPALGTLAASGRYPAFTRLADGLAGPHNRLDLDAFFEFGLLVLLDGLERVIAGQQARQPAQYPARPMAQRMTGPSRPTGVVPAREPRPGDHTGSTGKDG